MTTPGNVTFNTRIVPTTWSTVLIVKAISLYSLAECVLAVRPT